MYTLKPGYLVNIDRQDQRKTCFLTIHEIEFSEPMEVPFYKIANAINYCYLYQVDLFIRDHIKDAYGRP